MAGLPGGRDLPPALSSRGLALGSRVPSPCFVIHLKTSGSASSTAIAHERVPSPPRRGPAVTGLPVPGPTPPRGASPVACQHLSPSRLTCLSEVTSSPSDSLPASHPSSTGRPSELPNCKSEPAVSSRKPFNSSQGQCLSNFYENKTNPWTGLINNDNSYYLSIVMVPIYQSLPVGQAPCLHSSV